MSPNFRPELAERPLVSPMRPRPPSRLAFAQVVTLRHHRLRIIYSDRLPTRFL